MGKGQLRRRSSAAWDLAEWLLGARGLVKGCVVSVSRDTMDYSRQDGSCFLEVHFAPLRSGIAPLKSLLARGSCFGTGFLGQSKGQTGPLTPLRQDGVSFLFES